MLQSPSLTVFTPTYNRIGTLPRLYESLCQQTVDPNSFEWLIIDDGSTDDTGALVASWAASAPFAIRYIVQPHGGKHRAWNRSLLETRGDLYVVVDSDDTCEPQALRRFRSVWGALPAHRKQELAGIAALRQEVDKTPLGPDFPAVSQLTFSELVFRYQCTHDLFLALRSDLAKACPFPDTTTQHLIPEGTVLHAISGKHPLLLTNDRLLTYWRGPFHGRKDQLSRSYLKPYSDQAPGMFFALQSVMNHSFECARFAPTSFVHAAMNFSRFRLHMGENPVASVRNLHSSGSRALCSAVLPVSYLAYGYDRLRNK